MITTTKNETNTHNARMARAGNTGRNKENEHPKIWGIEPQIASQDYGMESVELRTLQITPDHVTDRDGKEKTWQKEKQPPTSAQDRGRGDTAKTSTLDRNTEYGTTAATNDLLRVPNRRRSTGEIGRPPILVAVAVKIKIHPSGTLSTQPAAS